MDLRTARLRIRRFTSADRAAFVTLMTDAESMRLMPFPPSLRTPEGANELLTSTIAAYDSAEPKLAFAVEELASAHFVGFWGLNRLSYEEAEVMYVIAPSMRDQGYATEVARAIGEYGTRDLPFRRIVAFIVPENSRSRAAANRAGFRDRGLVTNSNFAEPVCEYVFTRAGS